MRINKKKDSVALSLIFEERLARVESRGCGEQGLTARQLPHSEGESAS